MKTHLYITISGGCSESKSDIANDLCDFFTQRGYGNVEVVEKTNDYPWDGLLMSENVQITVN